MRLRGNRKKVLWALLKYPDHKMKDLAEMLDIKMSTFSTSKDVLFKKGLLRKVRIPCVQRLGSELLGVVYANFNPMISAGKRSKISKKTVEIYDELFLSVGEAHLGFSLNFAPNYTAMLKINDQRINLFSKQDFLEKTLPTQVLFSFQLSEIYRFFDMSKLLDHLYSLDLDHGHETEEATRDIFSNTSPVELSGTERKVYCDLITNPSSSNAEIAKNVGYSPKHIHNIRNKFESVNLYKNTVIPNLRALGIEVLHISHGRFNPTNVPDEDMIKEAFLANPHVVMFVRSRYEYFSLAYYQTYHAYKESEAKNLRHLRRDNLLLEICGSYTFSLDNMVVMKDLNFAPMVGRLLKCK